MGQFAYSGKFKDKAESSSQSSKHSTAELRSVIERLKNNKHQPTTRHNYLGIWRKFNNFVIKLDSIPRTWEDRTSLYVGHLFSLGRKSTTIKSYISAIKSVLIDDGYEWDQKLVQFVALTRAVRLTSDRVKIRLPIRKSLLNIMLREIDKVFMSGTSMQPYLAKLYKCIFVLGYYGLLRVGEMATGDHPVKAKDVHVGKNKQKILIVLFTSKTHGIYATPQFIDITADQHLEEFSPFVITNEFAEARGGYYEDGDPFFVFRDKQPVRPRHIRTLLRTILKRLNLEHKLYDTHSFRIGRATDLMKMGASVDMIKHVGRWKSNAVFRYIRE